MDALLMTSTSRESIGGWLFLKDINGTPMKPKDESRDMDPHKIRIAELGTRASLTPTYTSH
jgi:hypothetical protein